jgi:hypothetical protein
MNYGALLTNKQINKNQSEIRIKIYDSFQKHGLDLAVPSLD